ncbi:MAG: DUF4321 domain-containing protein [candidate division WOR-3 bacterium]
MAKRILTIRNIVAVILAGALGDILGKILITFLPKSPARDALLFPVKFGLSDIRLDLIIIDFSFGLKFQINLLSFLLIFLMVYILQKI